MRGLFNFGWTLGRDEIVVSVIASVTTLFFIGGFAVSPSKDLDPVTIKGDFLGTKSATTGSSGLEERWNGISRAPHSVTPVIVPPIVLPPPIVDSQSQPPAPPVPLPSHAQAEPRMAPIHHRASAKKDVCAAHHMRRENFTKNGGPYWRCVK